MDKFIRTYEKLAYCYRKIDYDKEYLKASEEERNEMCSNEKSKFLNALNSEDMKFSNFVRLKINNLKCKLILKFSEKSRQLFLSSL
jgi:hypothetical protein